MTLVTSYIAINYVFTRTVVVTFFLKMFLSFLRLRLFIYILSSITSGSYIHTSCGTDIIWYYTGARWKVSIPSGSDENIYFVYSTNNTHLDASFKKRNDKEYTVNIVKASNKNIQIK